MNPSKWLVVARLILVKLTSPATKRYLKLACSYKKKTMKLDSRAIKLCHNLLKLDVMIYWVCLNFFLRNEASARFGASAIQVFSKNRHTYWKSAKIPSFFFTSSEANWSCSSSWWIFSSRYAKISASVAAFFSV